MKRARAAIVALAVIAIGCGEGRSGAQAGARGEGAARAPGLRLRLDLVEDGRAIEVALRVTGPEAAKVRALRVTRGWADTHALAGVRDLRVRDAEGPIGAGAPVDEERFSILPLARAVVGDEVMIEYTARANVEESRLSLHRGAAGISGVGHAFLVRPAIAAELPLSMELRVPDAGSPVKLVTSLDGRTAATVEDLATAVYFAGVAGAATIEAGDKAIVTIGSPIEGSAVAAQAASVRGLAARAFGLEEREVGGPASVFVIGERKIGAEHDGVSTGGAIALWIDEARSFDEGARILVAHEVLHRVFGGAIRVGIEGYEAAWFAEGLATYYARRMLFDSGEIGPEAFLADLERTDGERSAEGHAGDRRAAEYSRGSRYAAMLDASLRARSKGKRSLDDVVRALVVEARKAGDAPLSVEAFRAVVERETGADEEKVLWRGLVANRVPELPEGAFGPCFRRTIEERTVPELGFDASSLSSPPQIIHGTVAGSAAERAGVKDGALVLRSSYRAGDAIDPKGEIELVVSASKGKKRIRYRPAATLRRVVFKARACKRSGGS